jgi:hypothetical protein
MTSRICVKNLVSMTLHKKMSFNTGENIPKFTLALKYRLQNQTGKKTIYHYRHFIHEEHMIDIAESFQNGQCEKCCLSSHCVHRLFSSLHSDRIPHTD